MCLCVMGVFSQVPSDNWKHREVERSGEYGWNGVPLRYEKMSVVDSRSPRYFCGEYCPSESPKKTRESRQSKVLSPSRKGADTVISLDSAEASTPLHTRRIDTRLSLNQVCLHRRNSRNTATAIPLAPNTFGLPEWRRESNYPITGHRWRGGRQVRFGRVRMRKP